MVAPSKRNKIPHFQRWSKRYEQSWLQKHFFAPAHDAILRKIEQDLSTEPESVLDIGCGTGQMLRIIHDRWPESRLSGIDPTPGMISMAQQLAPFATFEIGQAESLPFPDASFATVVSTISFHHWSEPATGLQEIIRVLQPQGRFFLADVVLPTWLHRLLPGSHFRDPVQISNLLQEAGLCIRDQQFAVSDHVLIIVADTKTM